MSDKFELYLESIKKEKSGTRPIGDKFFFGKYKGVDFSVVNKEYPWYISYIFTKEFSEPMEFEKARFRRWWLESNDGDDVETVVSDVKKKSKKI